MWRRAAAALCVLFTTCVSPSLTSSRERDFPNSATSTSATRKTRRGHRTTDRALYDSLFPVAERLMQNEFPPNAHRLTKIAPPRKLTGSCVDDDEGVASDSGGALASCAATVAYEPATCTDDAWLVASGFPEGWFAAKCPLTCGICASDEEDDDDDDDDDEEDGTN